MAKWCGRLSSPAAPANASVGRNSMSSSAIDAYWIGACPRPTLSAMELSLVVPAVDATREGAIAGGVTRSDSVRAGLARIPSEATIVCVHDGARPFASSNLFTAVICGGE